MVEKQICSQLFDVCLIDKIDKFSLGYNMVLLMVVRSRKNFIFVITTSWNRLLRILRRRHNGLEEWRISSSTRPRGSHVQAHH